MRGRSRFNAHRYRRDRLVRLERRVEFLDAERRRLEWLLGTALVVAVAGTQTKPGALLGVLCEVMPSNPSRARMYEERSA